MRQDRLTGLRAVGAAHGDLDAGLDRLRQVGEEVDHFGAGLEAVLGGEPPPLGGREQGALGDAEKRVVRLVVGAGREIRFVGRDQGQAVAVGKVDQQGLGRVLGVESVALQLDIELVVEDSRQALEARFGKVDHVGAKRTVERAAWAAGQRDQSAGADKGVERDVRLIALFRIEPQAGDQPHQVFVARFGLGEQHDRRASDAELGKARGRGRRVAEVDQDLRADNRLHA